MASPKPDIDKATADLLYALYATIRDQIPEDNWPPKSDVFYDIEVGGDFLIKLATRRRRLYQMNRTRTANLLHYLYMYLRLRIRSIDIDEEKKYNLLMRGEVIYTIRAGANRLYDEKFVKVKRR